MFVWIANLTALILFVLACYVEHDPVMKLIGSKNNQPETPFIQQSFIEKNNKLDDELTKRQEKEKRKKEIIRSLKNAINIKDTIERRKKASELKKEIKNMVETWGNTPEDVLWMQEIISVHIRPMKN